MTDVPADTPVTTPPAVIVATAGVALLHVPPPVASLNVVVDPSHTFNVPVIAAGIGLTVTVLVTKQPVPKVYDITDVPPDTPVITPPAVIVATAGVALLHVPPPVASLKVVVEPAHTVAVPVMAAGNGFTVTVAVTKQPVPRVYDMTDVPADTPVTTPPAVIVATAGVALLHVPPPVASFNVVVEPTHTFNVPVIAAGNGLIFIVCDFGRPGAVLPQASVTDVSVYVWGPTDRTPRGISVPEIYPKTGDNAYPVMTSVYGDAPPVITDFIVLDAPSQASPLPTKVALEGGAPTVTL